MEIKEYLQSKEFKLRIDETGWLDRNELIGLGMKLTKHPYWTVRRKTEHLSMNKLARILHECKGNPKLFYWMVKN